MSTMSQDQQQAQTAGHRKTSIQMRQTVRAGGVDPRTTRRWYGDTTDPVRSPGTVDLGTDNEEALSTTVLGKTRRTLATFVE